MPSAELAFCEDNTVRGRLGASWASGRFGQKVRGVSTYLPSALRLTNHYYSNPHRGIKTGGEATILRKRQYKETRNILIGHLEYLRKRLEEVFPPICLQSSSFLLPDQFFSVKHKEGLWNTALEDFMQLMTYIEPARARAGHLRKNAVSKLVNAKPACSSLYCNRSCNCRVQTYIIPFRLTI